ncbi:hypothetical protein [Xanthomonas vesicatoria]|uniref:Secreted protein n=1 Tax=Xanthomonas vesicatoria TaxID=56460 RepID=A0ABS8L9U2_9XANT|nr:hypothetical protein [Xanthomonas vesicatoria]APO93685.1 hypothetical protein BI313_02800 [Xanthomonas vesicatoria]APP77503.1 hypothetical protein BJD12_22345 [Xanthomonas vesicatoria ATCC 35937]MCC8622525.1 hypothetical protein [Xanthomonas vesicatoria]MCC8694375.1 hypothetical protein [Xanthomonas vesicatoria]MCC8702991.1 hypothetical protein [Xanthomonas vesicatoria]
MDKKTANWLKIIGVIAGVLLSSSAMAQCCSNGGVGAQATMGLGDSAPKVKNLAIDPSVAIYELNRDGVTYLQINDTTGAVRAVVARVDDALWVLPMGKDPDRVELPAVNRIASNTYSNALPAADVNRTNARLVYQTRNFTVHVRQEATGEHWMVSP